MEIAIAGASFPCGVSELGDIARRNGFVPTFLDHPHNANALASDLSPIWIGESVPGDLATRNGLLLPLLESWVSAGLRMPKQAGLLFDRHAATISRSKRLLSDSLAKAGIPTVVRSQVASPEEAVRSASACGYPVILRPDTGYSGRGVWVAESAIELRDSWLRQSRERVTPDFHEMRTVLDTQYDALVLEPRLSGKEWSIDCVVGPAGAFVIRICEKATTIVDGRPVTLGYRISDEPWLSEELAEAARRWCRALFSGHVVSFACFDVRRSAVGDLVPLDFSPRLGWDGIPHLVLRSGRTANAYAAALDAALSGDSRRLAPLSSGLALVHAFARTPGKLGDITLLSNGEIVSRRPNGFVIEGNNGLMLHRRVGSVLARFDSYEQFENASRTSAEWIKMDIM